MKKIITLFLLIFCFKSFAQEQAFKLNPIGFAYSGFEISYETLADYNNSFEISFASSQLDIKDNKGNFKSIGAEIKYKFFFVKERKTFEGFYISPVVSLARATRKSTKDSVTAAGFGLISGYQWIFQNQRSNGFIVDLNGGFTNYSVSKTKNINVDEVKGLKLRLGVSLGYAF